MRTKIITIQILVLFLTTSFISAQKNNSLNDKINNVKGSVNKIVISTDSEEIIFEGDDAKNLFTKMKNNKLKKLRWVSGDKDIDRDNVFILKHDSDEDFDLDIIEDGKIVNVTVEVEDENGEKKVTVTTNEDGEEKVETYEGKEADEYLDKMESENEMIIEIDVDSDFDDGDSIKKDVKIEVNDGVKKITETITENGKKSVKIYEGDEAEQYLKEHNENEERIIIKDNMKDGKKHKRVIIKKNIDKE